MTKTKKAQTLKLKGKTAVYIDWANVYKWKHAIKNEIDPKILLKYLKAYKEIKSINFYFGTDKNKKSKEFLKNMRKAGFKVTTKPVKYITVGYFEGERLKKRKCDFDIEICMDVYEQIDKNYKSFLFFSGDGDFAPLYKYLIKKEKQVMVIYEQGHVGKELWKINKLFLTRLTYLKINNPPVSRGHNYKHSIKKPIKSQ